jgi:hypothetical protein
VTVPKKNCPREGWGACVFSPTFPPASSSLLRYEYSGSLFISPSLCWTFGSGLLSLGAPPQPVRMTCLAYLDGLSFLTRPPFQFPLVIRAPPHLSIGVRASQGPASHNSTSTPRVYERKSNHYSDTPPCGLTRGTYP